MFDVGPRLLAVLPPTELTTILQFWLTWAFTIVFPILTLHGSTTKTLDIVVTMLMCVQQFPAAIDVFTSTPIACKQLQTNLKNLQSRYIPSMQERMNSENSHECFLIAYLGHLSLACAVPPQLDTILSSTFAARLLVPLAQQAHILKLPRTAQRLAALNKEALFKGTYNSRWGMVNVCMQCGKFKRTLGDKKEGAGQIATLSEEDDVVKFSRCGYCNVFMTCSQKCFALAWKGGHKENCHGLHKKEVERLEALKKQEENTG